MPDIRLDGYNLFIDGKRVLIKGFCYSPIPIGKDYEYDFWSDPGKPWRVDGELMRKAGANTVRFYRVGKDPVAVKRVLNELNRDREWR